MPELNWFKYKNAAIEWLWIRNWSHIATHLVVIVLLIAVVYYSYCCGSFWGDLFKNKPKRLHHFISDQDEIWQGCSSSKYALIGGGGFVIWRYTFKMAAMTSFHAAATWWVQTKRQPGAYAAASASSRSTRHSYLFICFIAHFILLWILFFVYSCIQSSDHF